MIWLEAVKLFTKVHTFLINYLIGYSVILFFSFLYDIPYKHANYNDIL